jgi:hypothetical protein
MPLEKNKKKPDKYVCIYKNFGKDKINIKATILIVRHASNYGRHVAQIVVIL